MKFTRVLSKENQPVEDQVLWRKFSIKLAKDDLEPTQVEVPASWSDTAAQIFATKYLRKAGVPNNLVVTSEYETSEKQLPPWLYPCIPDRNAKLGSETSAKQVFHRLAGAWTYHGWQMGLFENHGTTMLKPNPEKSARIFYDELYLILANQLAAPNSPQWFNTGLWWAYGIEGSESGQWANNYDILKGIVGPFRTSNAYQYPQPHACFIQPVNDDLVNPGGIMDLWEREVRLFKQGSGTGTNFSNIRAKGEKLSGGGISSGLMSFLEIGDRAAGAIKSGGTTRRAAKMVILDADHPEIEDFIDWKVREEQKAAALWAGSRMMTGPIYREYMLKCGLIPQAMIDRMNAGMAFEEFPLNYEGEAIRTVGGQNANNSVRLTDDFMKKLSELQGAVWCLKERTTGKIVNSMQATHLWNKICCAAWASADPGLQFHDTINRWHTCRTDGEIRASNPCSEYMFLDNTACNLASLNLGKFYQPTNPVDPTSTEFNIDLFCHVARLMTIVLDISVSMASFPSREIAVGSYNYRTLGLGYANLGGLLMRMGLPYDSNEGHAIAAALTSLLTATAYETSMDLATELGPFPRYELNKDSMTEVIKMHAGATGNVQCMGDAGTAVRQAIEKWNKILQNYTLFAENRGFRNAQVTLLAPTGTIGLLMDCDTLGVEPDFSLVKHKSLAGGGDMVLVNSSVDDALTKLGYKEHLRNLIKAYIKQHGTVEGCGDLDVSHWPVFDCAVAPDGFTRSIAPMGHVKMVATVQPFLSGAVSKTINMPNSATIEDVSEVYMQSWKHGLKAVALYRDGSKLAQPLNTAKKRERKNKLFQEFEERKDRLIPMSFTLETVVDDMKQTIDKNWENRNQLAIEFSRGQREYLPWRRKDVYTQKIKIGQHGQSFHITIGKYPDGRPGEIRLDWSRAGTSLSAMTDMVAVCISIALQYGVPVNEFVKLLADRKFEPAGFVEGHEEIKFASSISDFIARELALTFLGDSSFGQATSPTAPATQNGNGNQNENRRIHLEICPSCGEPALTRSGTCQTCLECGYNDGCGG